MEQLAKATDGSVRNGLGGIWEDLPQQTRLIELAPWLLIAALPLLLLEILERRFGLLSMRRGNQFVETISQRIPRRSAR